MRFLRTHLRSVGVASACVLFSVVAWTGCGGEADSERDGPLSIVAGDGELTLRPSAKPRFRSFGYGLCTKGEGQGVVSTIRKVRYSASVEPLQFIPAIRRVGRSEVVMKSKTEVAPPFELFQSAYGRPKAGWTEFGAEPGAAANRGHYILDLEGYKVRRSCKNTGDPAKGILDFIYSVEAGAKGAKIEEVMVDYTAGGRDYTAELKWAVTICGSALNKADRVACAKS